MIDPVHTVTDPGGAWAYFLDETAALAYAARVHGTLGPIMDKHRAHALVVGAETTFTTPSPEPDR